MSFINTNGSTVDTRIAVYQGESLEALTLLGANDDFDGNTFSRVQLDAVEGESYFIQVSSANAMVKAPNFPEGFRLGYSIRGFDVGHARFPSSKAEARRVEDLQREIVSQFKS